MPWCWHRASGLARLILKLQWQKFTSEGVVMATKSVARPSWEESLQPVTTVKKTEYYVQQYIAATTMTFFCLTKPDGRSNWCGYKGVSAHEVRPRHDRHVNTVNNSKSWLVFGRYFLSTLLPASTRGIELCPQRYTDMLTEQEPSKVQLMDGYVWMLLVVVRGRRRWDRSVLPSHKLIVSHAYTFVM